jgi:protoporphyrinogen oxidase
MKLAGEQSHSVAVVGAGMTGISAAIELGKHPDVNVTLLEARDHIGGLSDSFSWKDVSWDRFYHVVLSTDSVLIDFLEELGLTPELRFTETRSGFFGNGRLVSLSSTTDFIRFPFLSLWQKFRLATGILYSASLKDPSRLDRVYVRQWLTSVFGRRVYERIWDPLLRSKLGSAREETSAAFIWATIRRLYGARDGEEKTEQMGHVQGGYRRILGRTEELLLKRRVNIQTQARVHGVRWRNNRVELELADSVKGTSRGFDKVLLTVPSAQLLRLLEGSDDQALFEQHEKVSYLGVVCLVLVLRRSLSPYYVINLLDQSLPFTGIIEATNVVSPEELGGNHLVYLPKYAVPDDELFRLSDNEIFQSFLNGLRRVFPDLEDEDTHHWRVFREPYVQPLQEIGALERRKEHRTATEGVYLANSAMMKNTTLNNNAAITLGRSAAYTILEDIQTKALVAEVKNHV